MLMSALALALALGGVGYRRPWTVSVHCCVAVDMASRRVLILALCVPLFVFFFVLSRFSTFVVLPRSALLNRSSSSIR